MITTIDDLYHTQDCIIEVEAYTRMEGGKWVTLTPSFKCFKEDILTICLNRMFFAVKIKNIPAMFDINVGWRDYFEHGVAETQDDTQLNTRSSSMDKNIFAMLRDGAYTVEVQFYSDSKEGNPYSLELGRKNPALKTYTYVTDLPKDQVVVGAQAVVLVSNVPKVVRIVNVHEDLNISPNEDMQYKWLVSIVNFSYYEKLNEVRQEVETTLASSYRINTRNQFKQLLLATMDEATRTKLLTSLEEKKNA